jgi:hypothetical protein
LEEIAAILGSKSPSVDLTALYINSILNENELLKKLFVKALDTRRVLCLWSSGQLGCPMSSSY